MYIAKYAFGRNFYFILDGKRIKVKVISFQYILRIKYLENIMISERVFRHLTKLLVNFLGFSPKISKLRI